MVVVVELLVSPEVVPTSGDEVVPPVVPPVLAIPRNPILASKDCMSRLNIVCCDSLEALGSILAIPCWRLFQAILTDSLFIAST